VTPGEVRRRVAVTRATAGRLAPVTPVTPVTSVEVRRLAAVVGAAVRAVWMLMTSVRGVWLAAFSALLLAGCRGGAASRAAPLPQPQNMAQWVAIAVFVIGIWWLAAKITRG
jgi:hypothetical protein